jgi:hypothetical protein
MEDVATIDTGCASGRMPMDDVYSQLIIMTKKSVSLPLGLATNFTTTNSFCGLMQGTTQKLNLRV